MSQVTFYSTMPTISEPTTADKSALGTLPVRGFRHCEPLRLASGFGWYIYPPIDLAFQWDGRADLRWWLDGVDMGLLQPGHARQYPNAVERWNRLAPPELQDQTYPMLIRAVHDPGMLQIWSGWLVKTPPEWALLIRPVANVPAPFGYLAYEGLVETDTWFGPLFTNIVLTKTDVRIDLFKHRPLFQVQPIPRAALALTARCVGLDDWTPQEWDAYDRTVAAPNRDPHRQRGGYAIHSRQRPTVE